MNDREVWADSSTLKEKAAAIAAEAQKIEMERSSLLCAEQAEHQIAARAAGVHGKVGTFGYQVFDKTGTYIAMVVDEAGDYLPTQAVFSYDIADENPPMPAWAKKGKVRRLD